MRIAMETVAGLPELTSQCLENIFSHLDPRDIVRSSCVQKHWRTLVLNDEQLWKHLLAEELGVLNKQGADGNEKRSSWEAYASWRQGFSAEYWPYLGRAIRAWNKIKAWLASNTPDILATVRGALSEAQVAEVEADLGFALPPALKVLYRLHDGQALASDASLDRRYGGKLSTQGSDDSDDDKEVSQPNEVHQEAIARSIFCGMFGGYMVYDHRVVSRMLPLRRAALWRHTLLRMTGQPEGRLQEGMDRLLPLACSYNMYDKILMSDVAGGGVVVAKVVPGGFNVRDAVPRADTEDGPLRWFEEYARRLDDGWYEASVMDEQYPMLSRGISLFPVRPPVMVEAVTQGVRVRASVVFVPEAKVHGRYLFAYSIRFSLLEGVPLKRCQLTRRHWVIRPEPGEVETVEGEGVIGLYPILEPGQSEFVYCSCTHQAPTRGSMEGKFQFVPGTLDRPEGPPFDVMCPNFRLDLPGYIF